jgi:hypothetical protein
MASSNEFLTHFATPPYVEVFYKSDEGKLLSSSSRTNTETNEIVYDYPEGFDWAKSKESEIRERIVVLKQQTEHGKKTVLVINQNGIIQIYKNEERDYTPFSDL